MEFSKFTLCMQAFPLQSGTYNFCPIYLLGNVLLMGLGLGFSVDNGTNMHPFIFQSVSININVDLPLAVVDLQRETL